MELRAGLVMGERYTLVRCLGEGSQASVWEATQSGIGGFSRRVVLKIVSPDSLQLSTTRVLLVNEARLAANLRHPNIVEFYDLGEEGGALFIAMEYIAGWDLQHLLATSIEKLRQPLPWRIAARLLMSVCEGLDYAHHYRDAKGQHLALVHRDIKPSNILVTQEGRAKVIDFGVAKSAQAVTRTKTGVIKGTPAYMAPEQIRAGEVDPRTDLFSVGSALYELISATRPFDPYRSGGPSNDNEFIATLMCVLMDAMTPLDAEGLGLPASLVALIEQLLSKSPDDRPSRARDVQEALGKILQEEGKMPSEEEVGQFAQKLMKDSSFEVAGPETWAVPEAEEEDEVAEAALLELGIFPGGLPTGESIVPGDEEPVFTQLDNDLDVVARLLRQRELEAPTHTDAVVPAQVREVAAPQAPGKESDEAERGGGRLLLWALLVCLVIGGAGGAWWMWGRKTKAGTNPAPGQSGVLRGAAKGVQLPRSPGPPRAVTPRPRTSTVPPRVPQKQATKPGAAMKRSAVPSPTRRRPVAPRPSGPGQCTITITPPCQLFGKGLLGTAKGLVLRRPAGRYTFRCIHRPSLLYTRLQVRFRAGQHLRITRRYRKGKLFLLSFPWADVYLPPFGKIGRSQSIIQLPEGRHRLVLHKMGKDAQTKTLYVTIRPGQLHRPLVRW